MQRRPSFNIPLSVTNGFIALIAIGFIVTWLMQDRGQALPLTFMSTYVGLYPWTVVTYPFDGSAGPIGILFAGLWMYSIGASVENDLGSLKYFLVLLVFVLLCPLFIIIGAKVMNDVGAMNGPWPVVEAVTILWATRVPKTEVRLYGVLPIQARYLAWFGAALIFFSARPLVAPFLLIPLGLLWAFAANKLPIPYGKPRDNTPTGRYKKHWKEDDSYFADVKRREKEREERERLRKLFEGSIGDDEK